MRTETLPCSIRFSKDQQTPILLAPQGAPLPLTEYSEIPLSEKTREFKVFLYRGDSENTSGKALLTVLSIPSLSALSKTAKLTVHIDEGGLLTGSLEDSATGETQSINIALK